MYVYYFSTSEWKMGKKWEFESEKRRKTSNIFMCNEGIAKNQQQNTDEIYIFHIFLSCQKTENPQQGARKYSKQNTQERRAV